MKACLKNVASAILADVEPWLPARRIGAAMDGAFPDLKRISQRSFFPGGKMPPSTAGKDACRYITNNLQPSTFNFQLINT